MDCSFRIAQTKALISFAVTAKLICVFVFAYAKSRFSHDAAHFIFNWKNPIKISYMSYNKSNNFALEPSKNSDQRRLITRPYALTRWLIGAV